jgi:hypothetical protein
MVSPSEEEISAPIVRVCQIIVFALVTGVSMFMAITYFVIRPAGKAAAPPPNPILTYYVAPAFVGTNLLLAVLVPGILVARIRRQLADKRPADTPGEDLGPLLRIYQTKLIIGAALCESAAFFALICYIIEGLIVAIPIALLALAGVVFHFPTINRVSLWIDQQRELIEQERRGGF